MAISNVVVAAESAVVEAVALLVVLARATSVDPEPYKDDIRNAIPGALGFPVHKQNAIF